MDASEARQGGSEEGVRKEGGKDEGRRRKGRKRKVGTLARVGMSSMPSLSSTGRYILRSQPCRTSRNSLCCRACPKYTDRNVDADMNAKCEQIKTYAGKQGKSRYLFVLDLCGGWCCMGRGEGVMVR